MIPILNPVHRWQCPSCGAQHVTNDVRIHIPMHLCKAHQGLDMPYVEVPRGHSELHRRDGHHEIVERGDWIGKEKGVVIVDGRAVMAVHTVRDDGHDTHVYAPVATAKSKEHD